MPADVTTIQGALADEGLDGWLFYDFRGSDPIGRRILGLGERLATRRWFYCVPNRGEPRGLVSAVEPDALAGLPGRMHVYRTWDELQGGLATVVAGLGRVAMQYSPRAEVPSVSLVDAGTVELVRAAGVEVCSAADLIQRVEQMIMFGRDDDQFVAIGGIERFGHADGIMSSEVPFMSLADIVHVNLEPSRKCRGFSKAD